MLQHLCFHLPDSLAILHYIFVFVCTAHGTWAMALIYDAVEIKFSAVI